VVTDSVCSKDDEHISKFGLPRENKNITAGQFSYHISGPTI
jgi:hypothetical protein